MCITLYLCWASHCHCQCSLFCDTGTWAWSPQSLQSLHSWTRGHDTLPGAVARGFNASFNCIKGAVQQCLVLGGDYQKSLDKWYSGGPLRWWKVVPFNWQYITNCVKSSTKYHVPSYAAPCPGRWEMGYYSNHHSASRRSLVLGSQSIDLFGGMLNWE